MGIALTRPPPSSPLFALFRSPNHVPTKLAVEYYAQRATDGGLLISEAVGVDATSFGYPQTPGIYTREMIDAWKPITTGVRAKGGVFFAQLWSVGRVSHQRYQPDGALPLGPSALEFGAEVNDPETFAPLRCPVPRAMTTEEVENLPDVFAQAAKNAIEAGFDGVELHSAHGYLLEEFLKSSSNKRTDKYGGSIENRRRVVLETVDAVVAAIGADRTAIRLSPFATFNDAREEDPLPVYIPLLQELNARKLAYVHMVEPRVNGVLDNDDVGQKSTKPFRQAYEGTFITAGAYLPDTAAAAISGGAADLVAFGRRFISNPDIVDRIRLGAELRPYDRSTFYGPHPGHGPEQGYTDQPFLDPKVKAELESKLQQA